MKEPIKLHDYPKTRYPAHESRAAAEIIRIAMDRLWDGYGDAGDIYAQRMARGHDPLFVYVCHAITSAGNAVHNPHVASKLRNSITNAMGGLGDVFLWLRRTQDMPPGIVTNEMKQAYRLRWMQEMEKQFNAMSYRNDGYF